MGTRPWLKRGKHWKKAHLLVEVEKEWLEVHKLMRRGARSSPCQLSLGMQTAKNMLRRPPPFCLLICGRRAKLQELAWKLPEHFLVDVLSVYSHCWPEVLTSLEAVEASGLPSSDVLQHWVRLSKLHEARIARVKMLWLWPLWSLWRWPRSLQHSLYLLAPGVKTCDKTNLLLLQQPPVIFWSPNTHAKSLLVVFKLAGFVAKYSCSGVNKKKYNII